MKIRISLAATVLVGLFIAGTALPQDPLPQDDVQNYSQDLDSRGFEIFANLSDNFNFGAFRLHHQYNSVHFSGQKRGLRIVPQRGTIKDDEVEFFP